MVRAQVSSRNLIRRRPSISGSQCFSKVDYDPLRVRASWSRAPTDQLPRGHPFNLPALARSTAASRARGNRNAAGADGYSHGRFDSSFHPGLGAHGPIVNQRNVVEPNSGRSSKMPYYRRACSGEFGGLAALSGIVCLVGTNETIEAMICSPPMSPRGRGRRAGA
jgi:hypothetical protein